MEIRTENPLKIAGDIYAARVFALVGARLGLARWKQSVEHKLKAHPTPNFHLPMG